VTAHAWVNRSRFCQTLGVQFYADEAHTITGAVVLGTEQEGPPGYAHGGVLAALLDEAMGTAAWHAGHQVVAANLSVDFKQPVPLGGAINIVGRVESVEGRKVKTISTITLPDGSLAAVGRGLFIHAPHLFENSGFTGLRAPIKPTGDNEE
jgi:uncharacterized protein (TIGR00369 family)